MSEERPSGRRKESPSPDATDPLLRHPASKKEPPGFWVWLAVAVLLSLCFLASIIVYFLGIASEDQQLVIVYGGLAGLIGVFVCAHRMRKLVATSASELLQKDLRPPVLYLRSFRSDPVAGFHWWSAWAFMSMATEEEQLAQVLNELGPFIAIGQPGERLPTTGAARMYVSHDRWQQQVGELIEKATLLVLRAGKTPGFWWEVERSVGMMPPERIVFLLPFSGREYRNFKAEAEKHLPCPLPMFKPKLSLAGTEVKGILFFDRDWTPHVVALRVPWYLTQLGKLLIFLIMLSYIPYANPLIDLLKKALQPVVDQNGLAWRAPWMEPPKRPKFGFISLFYGAVICWALFLFGAREVHKTKLHFGWAQVTREDVRDYRDDLENDWTKSPEFKRAIKDVPVEQQGSRVQELLNQGYLLLNDEQILQNAQLRYRMMDSPQCGAVILGKPGSEREALLNFSLLELDEWYGLRRTKLRLALEKPAGITGHEPQIPIAIDSLQKALSPEERQKVWPVALAAELPDDEPKVCFAYKTILARIPALEKTKAANVVRVFGF